MRSPRLAAAVLAVFAVLAAPAPAEASVCQTTPPAKAPVFKGTPAEDAVYAPQRLAPLATGKGIRVAVIDSGWTPPTRSCGTEVRCRLDQAEYDGSSAFRPGRAPGRRLQDDKHRGVYAHRAGVSAGDSDRDDRLARLGRE